MPEATDHGTVDVAGAQIYYARYGKGDPVILLHGGLGNSDHWANQVPALADEFQVIAIDSRGQGRSTRTKARVTYDSMADRRHRGDGQAQASSSASLVGWSDGGEIALKLAIKPPRARRQAVRVRRELRLRRQQAAQRPPGRHVQRLRREVPRGLREAVEDAEAYDALVDWLLPVWRTPMGFTKDQLRAIQAPTLVADGDHDEVIVLDQIEEMAKLIPNAQLAVFADASATSRCGRTRGLQQGAPRLPDELTRQPAFERLAIVVGKLVPRGWHRAGWRARRVFVRVLAPCCGCR